MKSIQESTGHPEGVASGLSHATYLNHRWHAAQRWESGFWRDNQERLARRSMRRPLWKWPIRAALEFLRLRDYDEMPIGNDWNDWWADKFQGYRCLPEHIGNMLEIGCGPHTNTRLIMERCRVAHAVCSDPLFRQYLHLPRAWLRWAVRGGIVCGDDHPAESFPFTADYFDVVVMINVLEHTRDPVACARSAFRVLAPGGIIVLGNDTLAGPLGGDAGIGHPHWLSTEWLERHVASGYETVFKSILDAPRSRIPGVLSGCWLFIGKKPSTQTRYCAKTVTNA